MLVLLSLIKEYINTSETGESLSKEDIDYLIEKERDTAQYYTDRFISYMSFNAASKFSEYYSNSNEDVYPDKDANFEGGYYSKRL